MTGRWRPFSRCKMKGHQQYKPLIGRLTHVREVPRKALGALVTSSKATPHTGEKESAAAAGPVTEIKLKGSVVII